MVLQTPDRGCLYADVLKTDFRSKWPSKNNFTELDIFQSLDWQCPSLFPYFLLIIRDNKGHPFRLVYFISVFGSECFGTCGVVNTLHFSVKERQVVFTFLKISFKCSITECESVVRRTIAVMFKAKLNGI